MSGWDSLLNIVKLNRDDAAEYRDSPPSACPKDGWPLATDADGDLRCPFDGWTWDGTPEGKRGSA